MSRIGVFGGTFDPIHLGHLIVAEDVRTELDLDAVLFVPNREPPHKAGETGAPAEDRAAMVRAAVGTNPWFRLELSELERPGPSFAVDTLRGLRDRRPGDELLFLLGTDALAGLPSWRRPEALIGEFRLVAMRRPDEEGHLSASLRDLERRFPELSERVTLVDVPVIGISSREIRERVKAGRSIRYLAPEPVEAYIDQHGLYR